jgi:hypothetical protein
MSTFHIQLPPMPKPEDFGIKDNEWDEFTNVFKAKIRAYKEAVDAWKQAVSSVRNSN